MTGQTFEPPKGGFVEVIGDELESEYQARQERLLQRQTIRIEDHIAYEGVIELKKWQDTSGHGFKITLGLSNRPQLDFFDGVMSMRKSRGGQRYHAIVQPYWTTVAGERKPDPSQQQEQEWQFCGRGWAESQGAHIAIHLADRTDIAWWRMKKTADQVEAEHRGNIYYIMLLELDDDETVINQHKRNMVVPPPPDKGGPRSKAVARMMHDLDFIEWLSNISVHKNRITVTTFNSIDKLVKNTIGIKSKVELDNGNNQAWTLWEAQFHRPFIQHMSHQ